MSPRFGCDNKGVVHHGNHPWCPLPANQSQADVLLYYQNFWFAAAPRQMQDVSCPCGHLNCYLTRD
eukprot:scaffold78525_cov62-Cyclotella_meneghiniana.AAC.4